MAEPVYDLTITNGTLATHETSETVNIGITDGRFAALGDVGADQGREHIDATGLTILPGVIDTQVHFREPGIEHKEDLQSGSLAAVMGGVTGVFEMPNTKPPPPQPKPLRTRWHARPTVCIAILLSMSAVRMKMPNNCRNWKK